MELQAPGLGMEQQAGAPTITDGQFEAVRPQFSKEKMESCQGIACWVSKRRSRSASVRC